MSLGVGSGVSSLFLRSLGVGSGVSLRFWSDSGRDRHLKNAVILTPDSIFILCVD